MFEPIPAINTESERTMNQVRKFSAYDVENKNCKPEELGQPWQPRYGLSDIMDGMCLPKQLGKPIEAAPMYDPGQSDMEQSDTHFALDSQLIRLAMSRGIPLDDPEKLAFLALETNPEQFMLKNPTIYRDLMAEVRRKRIEDANTAGKMKTLTANQISAMYGSDIAMLVAEVLLHVLPIPDAEDRQAELMRLLKITPDMLTEIIDGMTEAA